MWQLRWYDREHEVLPYLLGHISLSNVRFYSLSSCLTLDLVRWDFFSNSMSEHYSIYILVRCHRLSSAVMISRMTKPSGYTFLTAARVQWKVAWVNVCKPALNRATWPMVRYYVGEEILTGEFLGHVLLQPATPRQWVTFSPFLL